MTDQELKQSLNMTLTNYNKRFDENIATLWKGLFINFNAGYFRLACKKIICVNKYFPNASEIIDAYKCVKYEAEQKRFEQLKESQRLLAADQAYCYLCENKGYCRYTISNYTYVARCVCSHGRDLNKFSEAQIDKSRVPEYREYYLDKDKAAIKSGRNPFYLPNVQETLKDDFAVYDAQRKDRYLSQKAVDDDKKIALLKELIEMAQR